MEARVASQAQRPYPNSPLGRRSPSSPARPRPRRIPRRRVPPPKSAAAGAQTKTTVPPPPAPATELLDAPSRRPLSASGAPRSPVGQRDRNPGPPAALRSRARPAPAVCPAPRACTPAPSSGPPGSAGPGSQPPAGPRARDEVWLRRGSGRSPGRVRKGAPSTSGEQAPPAAGVQRSSACGGGSARAAAASRTLLRLRLLSLSAPGAGITRLPQTERLKMAPHKDLL